MTYLISYIPQGRTGNNIFQYITCKLIEILYKKHIYVPDHRKILKDKHIILDGNIYKEMSQSNDLLEDRKFLHIKENNIICNGFFQIDILLTRYRDKIIKILE